MINFKFGNKSTQDFGIYALSVDRTLLPELVRTEVEVPMRHGTYDQKRNRYKNRLIPVQLGVLGDYTAEEVRALSRQLARWLVGTEDLIFDDEPDKRWRGKLYSSVDFTVYGSNDYLSDSFNAGTASIVFECQPFAVGNTVSIPIKSGINSLEYLATQETPTKIRLKNVGTTNAVNVKFTLIQKKY